MIALPNLSRAGVYAAGALIGLIFLAGLVLGVVATVNGMVSDAVDRTVRERNAHWTAQIEASNARVAEARAAQATAAAEAENRASGEIARLRQSLTELEARNAAIPYGNECGLDADRVRILPR